MARKALLECSFFIPVRRDKNLSDGMPHEFETWDWLETELHAFGGGTRAGGLYWGWYIDADTHEEVRDRSRRYMVAVPPASVKRVRRLLSRACRMFQQKAIYLSVAGRVEFVEAVHDP